MAQVATVTPHPAKYHPKFLPIFAAALQDCNRVIDMMAGTCRLADIRAHGFNGEIVCNELEPEWAAQGVGKCIVCRCDAEHLPFADNTFDGAATSPAYGNRMADHHHAKDATRRNTYTHIIGRQLSEGNTGAMQFGKVYCQKHKAIWQEQARILQDGGLFVLNVKDHIRKGRRVRVTLWHILCLRSLGFELVRRHRIAAPGNRQGANGAKRIDHESILIFKLHKAQ